MSDRSRKDLTVGSVPRRMLSFSVPFLISCFLQTFYGLADLLITGRFNGADCITAISVGSQVMHMVTVVAIGLASGSMVCIGRCVGAKDAAGASRYIGNSVLFFSVFSVILTALLLLLTDPILKILSVPPESLTQTRSYLTICFAGIPFITAYNVLSSVFRGLGDTRRPLIFVGIAGVLNVALDLLLIGRFRLGAAGAAAATLTSQAVSVAIAALAVRRMQTGVSLRKADLRPQKHEIGTILGVGVPIAIQEGLIQISFLAITAIANRRGVEAAAAVGVVEKIIGFLFLVPSSMLSTVCAFASQNCGAGEHARSRQSLRYGIRICIGYGVVCALVCNLFAPQILSLFAKDSPAVVEMGAQYLRAYALDSILACVHFCFSGFFSAYGKSNYSFVHNMISALLVRIPASYFASVRFPHTLYPMGLAAPLGSLVSIVICVVLYAGVRGVRPWQDVRRDP